MSPIVSGTTRRRKDSLAEVADWWGTVFSGSSANLATSGRKRASSGEFSPLLSDREMGESDEESHHTFDPMTGVDDSSRDALTSQPRNFCWNKLVNCCLLPIKILFPSKTLTTFIFANIVPALANLIPLFYTGKLPHESSLALAGQFQFISVILEVVQEGIGNSLFHFVGKNYKDKETRSEALSGLKLAMLLLAGTGIVLAAFTMAFTKEFVSFIDTPPEIVESTKIFLWLSSFSFPMILLNYAMSNFLYITTSGHIIFVQIIQLISTFLFNFFLFGQGHYNLKWNVDQLGIYKIIQSSFDLIVYLFFLHVIEGIGLKTFWWDISIRKDFKTKLSELFIVSWPNFGDSALRNFFYFTMTLKFLNSLGSTYVGAWNLLMTIMYGVFLIPTNSISSYVKVLVGHEAKGAALKKVIRKTSKEAFLCLTAWNAILILLGYIFWLDVAAYFNPTNPEVQAQSTIIFDHIGWTFVLLSYNNVMDSLFYGTGDTIYVFYQALGTDLSVYIVPLILFEVGAIVPTYLWVIGLWIAALSVDSALTGFFCVLLWRKISN